MQLFTHPCFIRSLCTCTKETQEVQTTEWQWMGFEVIGVFQKDLCERRWPNAAHAHSYVYTVMFYHFVLFKILYLNEQIIWKLPCMFWCCYVAEEDPRLLCCRGSVAEACPTRCDHMDCIARQAPLSSPISWSLLKLTFLESVMLSHHLILCHPFLLLLTITPSFMYSLIQPGMIECQTLWERAEDKGKHPQALPSCTWRLRKQK